MILADEQGYVFMKGWVAGVGDGKTAFQILEIIAFSCIFFNQSFSACLWRGEEVREIRSRILGVWRAGSRRLIHEIGYDDLKQFKIISS